LPSKHAIDVATPQQVAKRKVIALFISAFIGVLITLFLLGILPLKTWSGSVFLIGGIMMCVLALREMYWLKHAQKGNPLLRREVNLAGRPIFILPVQASAAAAIIMYYQFGGSQFITPFDLMGVLFFTISYATPY